MRGESILKLPIMTYGTFALAISFGFLGLATRGIVAAPAGRWARRVFIGSIGYLSALLGVVVMSAG